MLNRRTHDSVYLALLPAAFVGYLLKVLRLKGCSTDGNSGDIIWLRPPEEWCASVPDGPRSGLARARTFVLRSLLWPIAASELHFLVSIYTVLVGLLLLVTCTPRGRYTLDNPYRVAWALVGKAGYKGVSILVRLVRPATPWPLAISHTLHFDGLISAAFACMLPLPPRAQAATALLDLAQVAAICYLYGDTWPYGMHKVPFMLVQASCTALIIGTTYYVWAGNPRPQPGVAQSALGVGSASAALKAVLEAIPEGHAWGNCDRGCGGVRLVKTAVAVAHGAGAAAGAELQAFGYGTPVPTGLSLIHRRARRARMAGLYGGVAGDAVHVCVKLPGVNPGDLLPCWRQRVATAVAQRGGNCSIGTSTALDSEDWGYGVTTACMRSGCIELHLDLVGTAAALGPAGAQPDSAWRAGGSSQLGAPMVAQWQQQPSLQQQQESAPAAGPGGGHGVGAVLAGCEPAPVVQQGLATSILEALGLPQGYSKQVKAQVGAHLLTLAPAAPVRGSQSAAWTVLGSRRMQALDVPWVSHVQPPAVVTAVPYGGGTCAAAAEAADAGAGGARARGGEQEGGQWQGSAGAGPPPGHVAVQLCITVCGAMERLQHVHQDADLELLALFGGSFLRVLDVAWRPMGQPSDQAAGSTTVLPYGDGLISMGNVAGGSGAGGGWAGTSGGQVPGHGVLGQMGFTHDGQGPGLPAVRLPSCLSLARRQALVRVAVPVGRSGHVNLVLVRRGTAGQRHTVLLLQPDEAAVAAEVAALQRRALAAEGLAGEVAAAEAALTAAGAVLEGMSKRSNTPVAPGAALAGLPLSNVVTFMGDLGRWLQYRDYWGRQAREGEVREQGAWVGEELQQGRRAQEQQQVGHEKGQGRGRWEGALRWGGLGAAWIAQRVGGRTAAAGGRCSGCSSTGWGHGLREPGPGGADAGEATTYAGDGNGGGGGAGAAMDVYADDQRTVDESDTRCHPDDHLHPSNPHPHNDHNHRSHRTGRTSHHGNRQKGYARGSSGAQQQEEDADTQLKLLRGSLPCFSQPEYQAHMASVRRLVLEFALEQGMSSVAAEALKCVPLPAPAAKAAAAAPQAAGAPPNGLTSPATQSNRLNATDGLKAHSEPQLQPQHIHEPQQKQELLQARACCLLSMADLSRAMSPDGLSLLHRAVRSGQPHTVDVLAAAAAAAARAAAEAAAAEAAAACAHGLGTLGIAKPPSACGCAAARAGATAAAATAATAAGAAQVVAAEGALLRWAGWWDSVDQHGMTPLHYAAVLEDRGVLARHVVRRHAGAAAQWARGGPVPGVPSAAAFAAESGLEVDVAALRAEGKQEERQQREREGRRERDRAREAGEGLGRIGDGGRCRVRKEKGDEEQEGMVQRSLAGGVGMLCTLWRKVAAATGVRGVLGCHAHSCSRSGQSRCGCGSGCGRGGGGGGGGGGRSRLAFFTLQGLTCAAGVAQAFSSRGTAHDCELLLLAALALAAAAALVVLWLAAPAAQPPLLSLPRAAVDSTGANAREPAATSARDLGKQTTMPGFIPAAAVTAVTAAAASVAMTQLGTARRGASGGGSGGGVHVVQQWTLPPPPPMLQLHGWQLACGLQALAAAAVVAQAAGLGARGGLGSTPAVGSLPWRG